MNVEIKANVEGLDELKELLEVAKEQTVNLQETLDKISKSKIKMDKNKKAPNSFKLDAEMDDLIREKVNEVLKENHPVKIDIDTMVSVLKPTIDDIVLSTQVNKSKK